MKAERLVIMVAGAVLIGLTWGHYFSGRNATYRTEACEKLDVLRKAIDEYAADNGGEYPPSTDDYEQLVEEIEGYLPGNFQISQNEMPISYSHVEAGSFRIVAKSKASSSPMVMATSTSYARPIPDDLAAQLAH